MSSGGGESGGEEKSLARIPTRTTITENTQSSPSHVSNPVRPVTLQVFLVKFQL